jgi:hypothetical protein
MRRRHLLFLLPALGLMFWIIAVGCEEKATAPLPRLVKSSGPQIATVTDFTPCLDGEVDHGTTNCTSCTVTSNTTANTATVFGDESMTDNCRKRKQVVLNFDTSPLDDNATITATTLAFKVKTNLGLDVNTAQIRFHLKSISGSCPTAIDSLDFIGCGGGFNDLGTLTVSGTGSYFFTVPSPNSYINRTGITKIVLVDDSSYSTGDGQQTFVIRTNEDGTSTNRPKLSVTN